MKIYTDILERLDKILAELRRLYGSPMYGRNRGCFVVGDWVIKCPIRPGGLDDNYMEYREYTLSLKRPDYFFPLAKCYLIHSNEIPILYMEKVRYPNKERLPKWTSFVDCCQVGYNKEGRLVAYDYA